MALATTKIVQAYVQGLIEVINKIQEADALLQAYKAKFIAKNPDLTGTNITQAQITAVNIFIGDINTLANGNVATTIKAKDVPSHGTGALN